MNTQENQQETTTATTATANTATAIEEQRFAEHFQARVVGKVETRVGDGVLEEMPVGTTVQVDTALASYVLSWIDEEKNSMIVTLAKREFELYVDSGAIEVLA